MKQLVGGGLQPVRKQGDGTYHVASLDDRLNSVAGLSYAFRRKLVASWVDRLQDAARPLAPGFHHTYATWAGLEVLAGVIGRHKLQWNRPKRGGRTYALIDLLPTSLQPPGLDATGLGRAVTRASAELADRLFERGVFVANKALLRVAWQAVAPNQPIGRALTLQDGVSRLNHMSCTRVLDYYGVAVPGHDGHERGHWLRYWDLASLDQFMSNSAGLDLRGLPWARGRFVRA